MHRRPTQVSRFRAVPPDAVATVVGFERIKGVSSDWIMGHVRTGKEVFRKEIEDSG